MAGALSPAGRRSQINGCIRTTVHDDCVAASPTTLSGDPPTVATLRSDQEVDGVFACTRKERHTSRTGAPYLTLELRDRTGTIAARAFRDADALAGGFE